MTERLHFHFSFSCTGEGNGNPLQCSCLENPRDGGAWWAAVYGVAQSRTRLKRLSSSSSSEEIKLILLMGTWVSNKLSLVGISRKIRLISFFLGYLFFFPKTMKKYAFSSPGPLTYQKLLPLLLLSRFSRVRLCATP